MKRLFAFAIDYFGILFFSAIFAFLVQSSSILFTLYFSLVLSVILNKDSIRGQSLGKRFMNIRVVGYDTKQMASISRCIIRNITLCLWPIEIIVILVTPNRRIGDYIAGTEVVADLNKYQGSLKKEVLRVLPYVIITALCIFLPAFFIIHQSPKMLLMFN